jgi:hypothetical protein
LAGWGDSAGTFDGDAELLARTSRHYRNALAIERGPLVYSLKIGEQCTRLNEGLPSLQLQAPAQNQTIWVEFESIRANHRPQHVRSGSLSVKILKMNPEQLRIQNIRLKSKY